MRPSLLLAAALLLAAPVPAPQSAPDGPFFVVSATFSAKPSAQAEAARNGGWVLRTDLYRALTPGFFAVVHGPFEDRADAESRLQAVRFRQPEAYVRRGGASILPPALGDPALLAALLGEVTADVREGAVGAPCAPPEPHLAVRFAGPDAATLGGFYVVHRTGEVRSARACTAD
ncbi:MAG TPA: hypothetical protein VK610_05110 [Rhodothermales bacterium]|nr:hypothetical protein [Rhodothermales bacterium]